MSKVGNILKSKRQEIGIALMDVAGKTAIRETVLEKLEQGDFSSLPSYVHAHGFVQQYCKALGIDFTNDIKPLFEEECSKEYFGKTVEQIEIEKDTKADKTSVPSGLKAMFLLGLVIVVVAIVAVVMSTSDTTSGTTSGTKVAATPPNRQVESMLAVVDNNTQNSLQDNSSADIFPINSDAGNTNDNASVVVVTTPDNVTPVSNVAVAEVKYKAILKFSERCWTLLQVDNGTAADFIAEPGMERAVFFTKYFKADFGDSSAASISYGGELFTELGKVGQPIKNLYFTVDSEGKMYMTKGPRAQ